MTYHTSHKECKEAMKIIDTLLEKKEKMYHINTKLKQDLNNERSKVAHLKRN